MWYNLLNRINKKIPQLLPLVYKTKMVSQFPLSDEYLRETLEEFILS